MSLALLETSLPHLGPVRRGKVRDVYDLGDKLLIVATDRLSAFDVVMPDGVPDKGKALSQLSAFWFEKLASVCPHHMITSADEQIVPMAGESARGRSMLVRKTRPALVECVVRGYLAGSWWKEYREGARKLHGVEFPDGLLEGCRLPAPIFTPATKAESGHDENISVGRARDLLGVELTDWLEATSIKIYQAAALHAESCGLILADTKFEFGLTDDGPIWIDEALTPDSSRYWPKDAYAPGGPQASFDKQFVRDWLEAQDWDKQPPGPCLPEEVVRQTRVKYLEAFRMLTGRDLAL